MEEAWKYLWNIEAMVAAEVGKISIYRQIQDKSFDLVNKAQSCAGVSQVLRFLLITHSWCMGFWVGKSLLLEDFHIGCDCASIQMKIPVGGRLDSPLLVWISYG